jgi:uncharacterized repeat protein (TIGR03837 family)
MRWDIFCKVIDNLGDIGVCWRLAADLAGRGEPVRLWIDDASALAWMAPGGHPGVQVLPWAECRQADAADVVIEAFGCEPDQGYVTAIASRTWVSGRQPAWINLEYLSAEAWVERSHGLPSPVLAGPGRGLTKRFFFPGFTERTGGLLREPDLQERQAAFDKRAWLASMGLPWQGEPLLSLFCYEPPGLPALLQQLAAAPAPTRLLVTPGRPAAAVRSLLHGGLATGALAIDWLPLVPQRDYDHLLWSCDLNFVRGEDSVVRALWAGAPLVWQPYPQDDGVHVAKRLAFLDWLQAPASLRAFHAAWGDGGDLPQLEPERWTPAVQAARRALLAQPDLVSQLMQFVPAECG